MNLFIRQNIETIRDTQEFITNYLSLKNKGHKNTIFLSAYINLDKIKSSKSIYFRKKLKEISMNLKSKIAPEIADRISNNLMKLNLGEIPKCHLKSLAIFGTESFAGFLPIDDLVHEGIYVSKSLHLKPIIKWVYNWNQYYVITISQKSIKLLKADDFEIREIRKINYEEFDSVEENQFQKMPFIKFSFEKFHPVISKDDYPIIFAGVKENIDLAKKICKDPDLSIYSLLGNYDHVSYADIHNESLKIIKQINFDQEIFVKTELHDQGNIIEKDLSQIIKYATRGQIHKLFVAKDKTLWGEIDKYTGEYELFFDQNLGAPEDDLLDDLAEIVLSKGGQISVLDQKEIPNRLEAIAILK